MPSASVVVVTLYALCVFVTLLRADYEVILDHKDVADGFFSPDLPSTGLENADNPAANTYSIIGNFDAVKRAAYQKDDGAYQLKLQFTYGNGTTDLLEWTQTSWITEPTITGFSLIQAIGTNGLDYDLSQDPDADRFRGLGLNVGGLSDHSYLDGNGAYHGNWWQAVGTIETGNVVCCGIPGMASSYNAGQGTAQSQTLWIYAPDVDCASLDTALDSCSSNYGGLVEEVFANSQGVATNAGNIGTNAGNIEGNTDNIATLSGGAAANAENIGTNAGNIAGNAGDIDTLSSSITALGRTIDSLVIVHGEDVSPGLFLDFDNKDLLIIGLLVINLAVIALSTYICVSGKASVKYQPVKAYGSE